MTPIRILQVCSLYPAYVKQFYAARTKLSAAPYLEQAACLDEDGFGSAGVWKPALEGLGDFQVERVYYQAGPAQRAWAREKGVRFREATWLQDILLHQVRHFAPQIIHEHGCPDLRKGFLAGVKAECPNLRIISYQGVSTQDIAAFQSSDLVLSCLDEILEPLREAGINTRVLPHGFNPNLIEECGRIEKTHPVTFLGGLDFADQGHHQRLELLVHLKQRLDVKYFLQMEPPWRLLTRGVKRVVQQLNLHPMAQAMQKLPQVTGLYLSRSQPLYGKAMFQELGASRVTLNSHIDCAGDRAVNMRLYEATGMGACLVTDWKRNLPEIFEVDREVVAYRTKEECLEKIQYLLDHPSECARIAAAGQKRTLRDYNAASTVQALAPRLRSLLDASECTQAI